LVAVRSFFPSFQVCLRPASLLCHPISFQPLSKPKMQATSQRPDGRTDQQIRPMEFSSGLLTRSDGSVKYSQARTSVMVSINGPLPVKQREEIIDRAFIEVIFKSVSGQATNFDTEKADLIRQCVEAVLITSLHPCTKITVVVQVLRDDGALLAAALNGTMLALLDSGLQCRGVMTALSIAMNDERYILDPERAEEKDATAAATFAFLSNSQNESKTDSSSASSSSDSSSASSASSPSIQSDGILLALTTGLFDNDEAYLHAQALASKASHTISSYVRQAMQKKLARLLQE